MKILHFLIITMLSLSVSAQNRENAVTKKNPLTEQESLRWSHLDLEKDTIPGMSVDRAYKELLINKKGIKVLVGVIDSGVDIKHEDLKGKIWTNKKEIPNNGKDDDKNGYVDDVNGWNFLGDSNNENLEMTRIIKKSDDGSEIYKNALAEYNSKTEKLKTEKFQVDFIVAADKKITEHLGKADYTLEELEAIKSDDAKIAQSKMIMMSIGQYLDIQK